jgi:hypothetical protein
MCESNALLAAVPFMFAARLRNSFVFGECRAAAARDERSGLAQSVPARCTARARLLVVWKVGVGSLVKHAIGLCQMFALCLLACGSEHATRAPVDAAAVSGDADASVCAALGSCPAHSIGQWRALLEASEFGPGARLVATGGLGVLIATGDGQYRVARTVDPRGARPAKDWDFPEATRALAVVVPADEDAISVLTCGADGSHCSVWRADLSADEPSAWRERALPQSFIARGIAQDRSTVDRPVCAYGSGMYCWAQSWQAVIPESDELRLNAVAFGSAWSLAVGDHGRWFARVVGDAAWEEQTPLNDVALVRVDVSGGRGGVILGEGKLQAALGSRAGSYACLEHRELAALFLDPGVAGLAYAVTAEGHVIQQQGESACAYQELALSRAVLQTTAVPCGASNNPRLLTESALFGQSSCLEVP